MTDERAEGLSVVGRLLTEISWEGRSVRKYRDGGLGLENVLTAEVMLSLDFLPRTQFLGAVLAAAQGADAARAVLVSEIEQATITMLPEESVLNPEGQGRGAQVIVQPDALIESPNCLTLVEAKRIKSSAFQPEQLAREYLAVHRDARDKTPLLLLLLASPPPVKVKEHGTMSIEDAVLVHLESVHSRLPEGMGDLDDLKSGIDGTVAWTTWGDIARIVAEQTEELEGVGSSVAGTVHRLAEAVTEAIARHA